MGEEHQVCVLHGDLNNQLAMLNKDIGKVAGRVERIEAHLSRIQKIEKQQDEIMETLKNMQLDQQRQRGFAAGAAAIVSAIITLVGWVISHLLQTKGG